MGVLRPRLEANFLKLLFVNSCTGDVNHKFSRLMNGLPVLVFLLVLPSFWLTSSAATFTVTTTNDSGAGSLRTAITSANGTPGVTNLIQFNILPTNILQTITPVTQLPTITRPVIIDGYTQPGAATNSNAPANGFNGK